MIHEVILKLLFLSCPKLYMQSGVYLYNKAGDAVSP